MARLLPPASVSVGDWMPRITLPLTSGRLFDSWDPTTSGHARVYWLGAPPAAIVAPLARSLAACETLLPGVPATPPAPSKDYSSRPPGRRHKPRVLFERLFILPARSSG